MKLFLFLSLVILMGGCVSKPIDFKKEQGWTISQMEMQSEIEALHKMILFEGYRQNCQQETRMNFYHDTAGMWREQDYWDSLGAYEQKFYERLTDINRQLGKP